MTARELSVLIMENVPAELASSEVVPHLADAVAAALAPQLAQLDEQLTQLGQRLDAHSHPVKKIEAADLRREL